MKRIIAFYIAAPVLAISVFVFTAALLTVQMSRGRVLMAAASNQGESLERLQAKYLAFEFLRSPAGHLVMFVAFEVRTVDGREIGDMRARVIGIPYL
jgi:hypothetical protein